MSLATAPKTETAASPALEEARLRVVADASSASAPPNPQRTGGEGQGEGALPATPPAIDPAKLAELEEASAKLLGQVTWLLSLSPQHRYMFLADFDWRIRPAVMLRQCRLFHSKGRPVAFVSWAYVSDDIAGRMQLMPGRLQPQEWRSGNRFMLVDVVTPFGGAEQLVQEVIKEHGKGPAPAGAAVNG